MDLPSGVSLQAVALWAQISAETVRRVLRGAAGPCEATRRRAWSAIEGLARRVYDPVADALQDFRLPNGFYCRSERRASWGLEFSGSCGVAFHFVAEGGCYLRCGPEAPLRLNRGDFVLLPHGRDHILSDPGSR